MKHEKKWLEWLFAGVGRPEEMRQVTRAHLIAWRKDLERRGLVHSSGY